MSFAVSREAAAAAVAEAIKRKPAADAPVVIEATNPSLRSSLYELAYDFYMVDPLEGEW